VICIFNYFSKPILWSTEHLVLLGKDFGAWHIPTYLFMISTSLIVGSFLFYSEVKRRKVDINNYFICLFIALIGVFVGARIFSLIFWNDFGFNVIIEFFNPKRSAYSSFGGIVGGMLFSYLYCRVKRIEVWKFWDIVAIPFGIGIALGRVSCFLNPCCYGTFTSVPWGIDFLGDGLRHPTQLYDIANGLFVFGLGLKLREIKVFDGFIALLVFGFYSFIRFFIEFFRAEKMIGIWTVNHVFYGLFFVFCVGFIWHKIKKL